MDKKGVLIVLLFSFMIVLDRSNALSSRKLVTTADPNGSSNAIQDSSLPSPSPNEKKPNHSPVEATKPKDTLMTNPSDVESKGLNNTNTKMSSENSSDKKLDKGQHQDDKEREENATKSKTIASKSCKGNPICSDLGKTMIACVQDFEDGSNNLTLFVQNERDITLKVNLTFATSMKNSLPAVEIPGHGTEKVNITFSGDKSTKVILNAGNGDCELQIGPRKTMAVVSPSKSKDVDDPSKSKDVDDPAKPKNVDDPADSPSKPKDVDNPAGSPAKPKDVDEPKKSKEVDDPSKPKEADGAAKPKEAEDAAKPKEDVHGPAKSPKDDDDPSKSKDADDPAKSLDVDSPVKSKDVDNASKTKDVDDASKTKDVDNPSKPKDVDDPSKSKGMDPPPTKSEDVDVPPKPTSVDTPISQSNLVKQLSFYSKQVTPIYGAYFAFLAALVIGGSWAFCSFRKRRMDSGVPYQELEMGLPESSHAADVETAEGWDQDWDDDDWDEDKAIRSPGGGIQTKTISSNGLTSRATKKDGWDANWDN